MIFRRQRAGGFTLIELLVVVAIVGILAGVVVGQYRKSIIKAKEAVLKENLFRTRNAINQYFADKGRYPFDLHELVSDHYLRSVPYDPVAQSSGSWILIPSSQEEEDISLEPGIADLHSGASGFSLDGTPFDFW